VTALLLLAPAGLAVVCIACAPLPRQARSRAVVVISLIGIALGVALPLSADGERWRSVALTSEAAIVAGGAAAAAWLVVAASDRGTGGWDVAALVGVGTSSLALFVTNRWLVPAGLFWVTGSLAVGALAWVGDRGWGRLAFGVTDAAVIAAIGGVALQTEEWGIPDRFSGWGLWVVLGALLARGGAIPRIGLWDLLGTRAGAALPLATGGAFAVVTTLVNRAEPWSAGGVLAVALLALSIAALRSAPSVADAAIWPVALGLAAALVSPELVPAAATLAVLSSAAVALWPLTPARVRIGRALVLAAGPATLGVLTLAGLASSAFQRAITEEGAADVAPWLALAALLPVSMAAGVLLAARAARQHRPSGYEPGAVIGSWSVVLAALFFGVWASPLVGNASDMLGSSRSVAALYCVASVAGLVAARWAPASGAVSGEALTLRVQALPGARFANGIAVALSVILVVAIGALTYQGLTVGFL
jgi:hypothetical protein